MIFIKLAAHGLPPRQISVKGFDSKSYLFNNVLNTVQYPILMLGWALIYLLRTPSSRVLSPRLGLLLTELL